MVQPFISSATSEHARIVCFGEVLARFSTRERSEVAFAATLDLHIGGAEANVAAALACLGHHIEMITALPIGRCSIAPWSNCARARSGTTRSSAPKDGSGVISSRPARRCGHRRFSKIAPAALLR